MNLDLTVSAALFESCITYVIPEYFGLKLY